MLNTEVCYKIKFGVRQKIIGSEAISENGGFIGRRPHRQSYKQTRYHKSSREVLDAKAFIAHRSLGKLHLNESKLFLLVLNFT